MKNLLSLFALLAAAQCLAQTDDWSSNDAILRPIGGNVSGYTPPGLGGGNQALPPPPTYVDAADEVTPLIESIASALGDDPVKIYEWVKNNIDFEPYYGVKRGATLTAIERVGNDFDTSALLVALLKASGYTSANVKYKFENLLLESRRSDLLDGEHWLGVDKAQIEHAYTVGGCEYPDMSLSTQGNLRPWTEDSLDTFTNVPHVYVTLTIGATQYVLDPSFKTYKRHDPYDVSHLSVASVNYSGSVISTAAGGVDTVPANTTASSVYTMTPSGRTAMRTKLTSYAKALADHCQNAAVDKSGLEIAGGLELIPVTITALPTSLPACLKPNLSPGKSTSYTWDRIPSEYAVSIRVTVGNLSFTSHTAALAGRKLSVLFAYGGAQIWLDDDLVQSEQNFDATSPASASIGYTFPRSARQTQTAGLKAFERNSSYSILYGFGRAKGRLEQAHKRQADYVRRGLSYSGRELKTENLNIVGLNYACQLAEQATVLAGAAKSTGYVCFIGGAVKNAGVSDTISAGVDVQLFRMGLWPRDKYSDDQNANHTLSFARRNHLLPVFSYMGSMLEHAAIMQALPGRAVSTVGMLERAAEFSTPVPVYYIGNTTDYDAIKGNFEGLTESSINAFKTNVMNAGGTLLIPKKNNMTVGTSYFGTGYIIASSQGYQMKLAGGSAGGDYTGATDFGGDLAFYSDESVNQEVFTEGPINLDLSLSWDPVDLTNGSFYHTKTDLTMGDAAPDGLELTRSYSSARKNFDLVGLGGGWTHSYDLHLDFRSPNNFELQRASGAEVAPLLLGYRAILDTLDVSGNSARTRVVPAVIACWVGEQLVRSRAVVTMGERSMEFAKLPDGSFAAPSGVAATLAVSGTGHKLTFRKGLDVVFRSDGKFTSINDRRNASGTAYSIDATYRTDGRLSTVTDSYSRKFTFSYDYAARLISVSDSAGRKVSYGRELTGAAAALTVEDADGNKSSYLSDDRGLVCEVRDGAGRTIVTSTYDEWDKVVEQRTYGLDTHIWRYGIVNGLAREMDPEDNVSWRYYDRFGREYRVVDQEGGVSFKKYDGASRIVESTSAVGETTSQVYNKNHEVVSVTNASGNTRLITPASDDSVTTPRTENNFEGKPTVTTFSTFHKPLSVTQPGGIVSEYQYDSRGRIWKARPASFATGKWITYAYTTAAVGYISQVVATYPDTSTEIQNFDAIGNLVQFIDRCGRKTTYAYTNSRKILQRAQWTGTYVDADPVGGTPPAGSLVENFTYDSNGEQSTRTVAGRTTRSEHDPLGKLTTEWRPDGTLESDRYYDARNLLASVVDGAGNETSYVYGPAAWLTRRFDPLVRLTEYAYDAAGRRTSFTTPREYTSSDQYNTDGGVSLSTDAESRSITFGYDKDGRRKTVLNRRGNTYSVEYDDANRKVTSKTALLRPTVTERNQRGLVYKVTEPTGQFVENTLFDGEGRILTQQVRDAGGALVATRTFVYFANGLLYSVTETPASGTERTSMRFYDDLNRLYSYYDDAGNYLGYRYDEAGNLSQLIYPDGKTVFYTYDANNRLWKVKDWANRETVYSYDSAGRVSTITRPNGTWRKMVYDAAGQLRQVEERKAGTNGAVIWLQAMRYDYAGRDMNFRKNDGEITWSFQYPAPQAFTLPADVLTYDADNQLSSWTPGGGSAQTPIYDADGNLTTGPRPDATPFGYVWSTFGYDTRNRLTSAGGVSYRYNADGHRVQAGSASYVVDPAGELSRVLLRNDGGIITRYVWGIGLLHEEKGADVRYYHADHLGSIVALTDVSANVTDRFEYTPFGSLVRQYSPISQTLSTTPFRYVGALGVMTDVNGLIYMRARYYNPRIGRFLNVDPIGFEGGMNWFAYAAGNPVSNADPSGLFSASANGMGISGIGYGLTPQQAHMVSVGAAQAAAAPYATLQNANWGQAGISAAGVVANGAVAFLGAATFESGLGTYVLFHTSVATVLHANNFINAFAQEPAGPTGPLQFAASVAQPQNQFLNNVTQVADTAIPMLIASPLNAAQTAKAVGWWVSSNAVGTTASSLSRAVEYSVHGAMIVDAAAQLFEAGGKISAAASDLKP